LANGVSPDLYDFLAPAEAADEIGRLGGYRVLKVLGSGGMGVVYQAEEIKLKRMAALKALLPQLAASPSNRERFLREAQMAAALEHDHIVAIHQVGEDRGIPFIAMQLLKGQSLEDRLKKKPSLSVEEVLRIGRETAAGLQAAHTQGLIHRDIKPANIWLESPNGRVKILDFGLARATGTESHLTQQGAIIGTPAYMAPEQASGKTVGPHADLFSLGCDLYRMSTGRLAFDGTDTITTLMAVATHNPRPPHKLNPDLPLGLSQLILRLLAKDAADRPKSAREVIAELEEIERNPDPTVVLPPEEPPTPKRRPRRLQENRVKPSIPWLMIGGGGVLLLGLVLLVVVFIAWGMGRGSPLASTNTGGESTAPTSSGPTTSGGRWWKRDELPADELARAGGGNPAKVAPELVAVLYDPALTGPVSNAAFSPDGQWLATGHGEKNAAGSRGVVKIWDLAGAREARTLRGLSASAHGLAFHADSKRLAAGAGEYLARSVSGT
jgi:serine/threonine protein kinase